MIFFLYIFYTTMEKKICHFSWDSWGFLSWCKSLFWVLLNQAVDLSAQVHASEQADQVAQDSVGVGLHDENIQSLNCPLRQQHWCT
mmetsp:Transcript_37471/g.48237  ORF Transcript_37471/g.48237 Transcript_37471/m.48237 type:complete len:86 (-) Transcript_37471:779-1036(-)